MTLRDLLVTLSDTVEQAIRGDVEAGNVLDYDVVMEAQGDRVYRVYVDHGTRTVHLDH